MKIIRPILLLAAIVCFVTFSVFSARAEFMPQNSVFSSALFMGVMALASFFVLGAIWIDALLDA